MGLAGEGRTAEGYEPKAEQPRAEQPRAEMAIVKRTFGTVDFFIPQAVAAL